MNKLSNRSLITGGFGFIGYHLACELLSRGEKVILFGHRPKDDKKFRDLQKKYFDIASGASSLTFRYGDFAFEDMDKVVHDEPHIAMIYHLAAQKATSATAGSSSGDLMIHNYDVDMSVFEFAEHIKAHKEDGGPVKLIYMSSGEVYGNAFLHGTPLNEGVSSVITPKKPAHIYPASKLMGEMLLMHGDWDFQWNIVRLQNPYGPGMGMDMLIPKLLKAAVDAQEKGKSTFLLDYPDDVRPYVYVADVARALGAIMDLGIHGEVYNVAGKDVVMNYVARCIADAFAPGALQIILGSMPGSRKSMDITKVNRDTGWMPTTDLEEGLLMTYEWCSRTYAIERVVNGVIM